MQCTNEVVSTRTASNDASFMRRLAASFLLLTAATLATGLWSSRVAAQTDPAVPAPSSLIVKLVSGLTIDQQTAVIVRNGGVETSTVPALRLHIIEVGVDQLDEALARYQADSQVARVEVNNVRQSNTGPSDPLYPQQWALPRNAYSKRKTPVGRQASQLPTRPAWQSRLASRSSQARGVLVRRITWPQQSNTETPLANRDPQDNAACWPEPPVRRSFCESTGRCRTQSRCRSTTSCARTNIEERSTQQIRTTERTATLG